MQTLRILDVKVIDSSNIGITFTEYLTPNLVVSNISIISDTSNYPDSEVLEIKINKNILSVKCQPLTPLGSYFIKLQSVASHRFLSINGNAVIPEDGITNKYLIIAPLEPQNPIQDYLKSYLKAGIYNLDDDNTLVSKYIKALSITLSRALYDIRQLKNENYLSFTVTDESKVRGGGPFDRLSEESAYDVLRVGLGPSHASVANTFLYETFPSYPITLQKQVVKETLHANSTDNVGYFNINTLTFNLSKSPATRVNSITFTFTIPVPVYNYSISILGYQIKDSRYDQDYGFSYLQLKDNQIKISEKVLEDPHFSLDNIFKIDIEYEYKNLGIIVDDSSVTVTTKDPSIRETLPPIVNVFNLRHAPIIDTNNKISTINGVAFTDPNSNIVGAKHPAFVAEIPFRLNALPSSVGQYSIDYSVGQVYVYGAHITNDGTGAFPPLATYNYQLTYKHEQDYVYDPDLLDIVALPFGNLIKNTATIRFNYEQVFVPNVDYKVSLHKEELSERVDNRLLALNALRVQNSPITNVFRIFNETSGEIYTLNRWNDDKIYFRYNTPPSIVPQTNERASFVPITNELLFTNLTIINGSALRVFKILLDNNTIVASTEDTLGSSFNTSVTFSNSNIFVKEKWFDRDFSETNNINRLTVIGEYMIDYTNGIVYVAASNTQGLNIGTATYKSNTISPQFPHIISVEDIYYRISSLDPKNKSFAYTSFDDGKIVPETLAYSDELFLNDNSSAPYQLYNGNVGAFINTLFVKGVTNQIKSVRSIYEYTDLLNSINPINFAFTSASSGFDITVSPIVKEVFDNVKYDGVNFYVIVNENVPYLSSNITYSFNMVRVSNSQSLWNVSGIITAGNSIKLILPGINSPAIGDLVKINYSFTLNDLSRLVIDYNKGDFFTDYTYVADEIIVSYEYGDNLLDFRTSKTIPENTQYFVTYKAGALRNALLKNFGTLVNVPELATFNIDFDRERYREALMAALSSFIQGPTITAIKNIGKTISHIEPEVIESVFQNWSLGSSLLNPEPIETTGAFELLPAKFSNGVLVDAADQTIKFPTNSNLRLEEGTFETWLSPQWNGLDNDADLTFNILKDGYSITASNIFIGAAEYHPSVTNGTFALNKNTNVSGTPNTNKDGIYIYYDKDMSGIFSRWYLKIIDGYVDPGSSAYKIKVSSSGGFYDTKSTDIVAPSNLTIFSGVNSINFGFAADGYLNSGITFLSDLEHYILDFGETKDRNRLSIYKDISGYINFRALDKDKKSYSISADVSSWKINEPHHISASWKLNSYNNRDEMHLFIDGFEVPNIIKYGQKLRPYLHEKFRTVDPEEVIGLVSSDIVSGTDLHTTRGNSTVSSSINFSSMNIQIGNTIYIDEIGYTTTGYTILGISGQTLILNAPMPTTLVNARFSVNRTQFTIISDIDIVPNIAITTIHVDGYHADGYGTIGSNILSSYVANFITEGVLPGYLVSVGSSIYTILKVINKNNLMIDSNFASTFTSAAFSVYSNKETEIPGVRAVYPSYSISKDVNFNNILTISNDVFAKDLILIRTLGLNNKLVKKQHYIWADGYENILMTNLPAPISLDETKITKIILPSTYIGPSNSHLVLGKFNYTTLDGYSQVYKPTNNIEGRTISVTISGNNADFSSPVLVTIDGYLNGSAVIETVSFSNYGNLDFLSMFSLIHSIGVVAKPISASKNAINVIVKEKYSMTHLAHPQDGYAPIIRYSYHIAGGYKLHSDGVSSVRDETRLFSALDVNNYLVIYSPINVAGYYKITGISADRKGLTISSTFGSVPLPLPSFTNAWYQILNVVDYRSGLQNGFFTLEVDKLPGTPYLLSSGFYELEYSSYASIRINPINKYTYIGSDLNGEYQINSIIDQAKIYSVMLADTRVGESIPTNQRSITKDYNSLKALTQDASTLMLIDFDSFPFINSARFYISPPSVKHHFQSSIVVNENFNQSLVITDDPIIISNDGILDTKKEGTVEFWVNPLFDTSNDPATRFYFDAFSAVQEEVVSINNTSVKVSAPASRILNIKLKAGDPSIDYFAGGKLEIDTQRAIQEESVSASNSSVVTAKSILQVISIKIVGDLTEIDYFANGTVSSDHKTIYLGKTLPSTYLPLIITYQTIENSNNTINTQVIRLNKKLPNQNSRVIVSYIPSGLQGDRLSLYKDEFGYINFGVSASGIDYVVRAPTRWSKGTWHRVKASYKFNSSGHDEMRLFLDGYEWTNKLFGTGLLFGSAPFVLGASTPGDGYNITGSINFKDPINTLYIGSQYTGESPLFSLIDNFRISDLSRPIYSPYGENLDVNYSSNLNVVLPVTSDLFTTYLLDFNSLVVINDDFTTLKNRKTGLFDFNVNIVDSLGIVKSSAKVREVLEKLIKLLKPANSRVFIGYI